MLSELGFSQSGGKAVRAFFVRETIREEMFTLREQKDSP